jgi:hypothetical protein
MKYRDNLTEAEAAALLAELAELGAAYAAASDAAAAGDDGETDCPIENGWLDKRGQP